MNPQHSERLCVPQGSSFNPRVQFAIGQKRPFGKQNVACQKRHVVTEVSHAPEVNPAWRSVSWGKVRPTTTASVPRKRLARTTRPASVPSSPKEVSQYRLQIHNHHHKLCIQSNPVPSILMATAHPKSKHVCVIQCAGAQYTLTSSHTNINRYIITKIGYSDETHPGRQSAPGLQSRRSKRA